MDVKTQKLVEQLDALSKKMEASPMTLEEQRALRASIQVSKVPRLAHHLLVIKDEVSEDKTRESISWIIEAFRAQDAEIARLKKYQFNARRALKSLQAAYSEKSRLLAMALGSVFGDPRALVRAVIHEVRKDGYSYVHDDVRP